MLKMLDLEKLDADKSIVEELKYHMQNYGLVDVEKLTDKTKDFILKSIMDSMEGGNTVTDDVKVDEAIKTIQMLLDNNFIAHAPLCEDCKHICIELYNVCAKFVSEYNIERIEHVSKELQTH